MHSYMNDVLRQRWLESVKYSLPVREPTTTLFAKKIGRPSTCVTSVVFVFLSTSTAMIP